MDRRRATDTLNTTLNSPEATPAPPWSLIRRNLCATLVNKP